MNKQSQLTELLFRGLNTENPIQSTLDIAATYFDCSVFLIDVTGKIIACHNENKHLPDISSAVINPRRPLPEMENHFYPISTGNHHFLYLMPIFNEQPVPVENNPQWDYVLKTLELLCQIPPFTQCDTSAELLLYDLLSNPSNEKNVLEKRCHITGLSFKDSYGLMAICNAQSITDLPDFSVAKNTLSTLLPDGIFTMHHNRLVILYKNKGQALLLNQNKEFISLLKTCHLTAAISLPFPQADGVYKAYIQTLQALDEGLSLDSHEHLYVYQDYLPYHALLQVEDPENFCHPCIEELTAYDALYQTDYTHTLYTYIMNFRNMKDTAHQLNIHYNTLKYRLKKIDALLDFSLEDPDMLLLLYMSFIYMKLHGSIF